MTEYMILLGVFYAWVIAAVAVRSFDFYRNEHVLRYRMIVASTMPLDCFDRLPSRRTMYWQLFRWDWSDYLEGEK